MGFVVLSVNGLGFRVEGCGFRVYAGFAIKALGLRNHVHQPNIPVFPIITHIYSLL